MFSGNLIDGYVYDEKYKSYTCIFCGEIFNEGFIYNNNENLFSASKMMEIHIKEEHDGAFDFLLGLDRKHNNLTERQREIHGIIYNETDNGIIAKKMETTPATVRSYKFKMRERLRQAKVYMALYSLIEKENEKNEQLDSENIRDIAIYERLKEANKDQENLEIEDIVKKEFSEVDFKNMNLLINKNGPSIKK